MDEATRDRASRVTRIRERRLEWIGLGTRRSCASARVCPKKERKIQEPKKDAKKLLTTAGLVRDCPSSACGPAGFPTDSQRALRKLARLVLWQNAVVLQRLTDRKEWKFFAVLPKADPFLAAAWWTTLLLRGILPAAFAIAMGVLVTAAQRGHPLAIPLAFTGVIFVLLQVLSPLHQ